MKPVVTNCFRSLMRPHPSICNNEGYRHSLSIQFSVQIAIPVRILFSIHGFSFCSVSVFLAGFVLDQWDSVPQSYRHLALNPRQGDVATERFTHDENLRLLKIP